MGKKMESDRHRNWHRLFGLVLTDFFTNSPFTVEMEKDLSLKQQYLDVVILRKGKGKFKERLPDGLDDLVAHNLITFKSHRETLDDWALKELTGHYVNYRKQQSTPREELLPEEEFHLYAVCSRYPHNLAGELSLQSVLPGVYDVCRGTDRIRIVVVEQLSQSEHNAPLHLFSASAEIIKYAASHYQQYSEQTSTLLWRKCSVCPLLLTSFFSAGSWSYSWHDRFFLHPLHPQLPCPGPTPLTATHLLRFDLPTLSPSPRGRPTPTAGPLLQGPASTRLPTRGPT